MTQATLSPPELPRAAHLSGRDMLIRCRDQFQMYGDQHLTKTPPQLEKAEVNYRFVADINAALLMFAHPPVLVVPEDFDVGDFGLGAAQIVRSPDTNPENFA